ncbi:MAG: prepilin-type N-terminal cleavage/methylation domain-containing protein [Fimbriimonas sp.]
MHPSKRAFTLIELLVVIAIIAILAAILFPVFAQAKQAAKKTAEMSQIKQVGLAAIMYAGDYDDTAPHWGYQPVANGPWLTWRSLTLPYIKSKDLYRSPTFKFEEMTATEQIAYAGYLDWSKERIAPGLATIAYGTILNDTGNLSMTEIPRPASIIAYTTSREHWPDVWTWDIFKPEPWVTPAGKGNYIAYSRQSNFAYVDGHTKAMNPCRSMGSLNWVLGAEPPDDFGWNWHVGWDDPAVLRQWINGDQPGYQESDWGCLDVAEYSK